MTLLATDLFRADGHSVERSGAAQGLSEVLAHCSDEKLDLILPELLSHSASVKSNVREGHLTLLIYLPAALRERLESRLHFVLPYVLKGLADELETIRDVAIKAGHSIIDHFAETALPVLLPAIESGLFDGNWRIRQSSVQLLGDILYRITGTAWKALSTEAADTGISNQAKGRAVLDALGPQRRNVLLASLYMLRSDVNPGVQMCAAQVWKSVVDNGPKTLKEVLPSLIQLVVDNLASDHPDKQTLASRAVGDLVRRLQDRVLPEIIPILQEGLSSADGMRRHGVCAGLREVMLAAGKVQVQTYMTSLLPTLRTALVDELPTVREAAAVAYDTLFSALGPSALEEVIPTLTAAAASNAAALDGLRQLMTVRPTAVLPQLLPIVFSKPVKVDNIRVLSAVADVTGTSLLQRLGHVVRPLIECIVAEPTDDAENAVLTIFLALPNPGGENVIKHLTDGLDKQNPVAVRVSYLRLLGKYVAASKCDLSDFLVPILRHALRVYSAPDASLLTASYAVVDAVIARASKEEQAQSVSLITAELHMMSRDSIDGVLPGLMQPQGLLSILQGPYNNGLVQGVADIRENCALMAIALIQYSSLAVLESPAVHRLILGPAFRIASEKLQPSTRHLLLKLILDLAKRTLMPLKMFASVLPRVGGSGIENEPNKKVREVASELLITVATTLQRVDHFIADLVTKATKAEDDGIRESYVKTVSGMVGVLKGSLGPEVLDKVGQLLKDGLNTADESLREQSAQGWGAFIVRVGGSELRKAVSAIASADPSDWMERHGLILAVSSMLGALADVTNADADVVCAVPSFFPFITSCMKSDRLPVRLAAVRAVAQVVAVGAVHGEDKIKAKGMAPLLSDAISDPNSA